MCFKVASAVAEGRHQGNIHRLAQAAGRKLGHLPGHVFQALHIPVLSPAFHEIREEFQNTGRAQTAGSAFSAGLMDKEFKDLLYIFHDTDTVVQDHNGAGTHCQPLRSQGLICICLLYTSDAADE